MSNPWWDDVKQDWNWAWDGTGDTGTHFEQRAKADAFESMLHGRRITVAEVLSIPGTIGKYELVLKYAGDFYDVRSVNKRQKTAVCPMQYGTITVKLEDASQIRINEEYEQSVGFDCSI